MQLQKTMQVDDVRKRVFDQVFATRGKETPLHQLYCPD